MPSIFTHAVVPLAARLALGRRCIGNRLLLAGIAASMLADADVAAFALGIPYADAFGHRGVGHSLLFCCVPGLLAMAAARPLRTRVRTAGAFVFLCALSHPLLDAMTSGGLGVALGWPWSDARWFAPWRPIRVSPIGARFFSPRGWRTLVSELRWVWLPLLGLALAWRLLAPRRDDAQKCA